MSRAWWCSRACLRAKGAQLDGGARRGAGCGDRAAPPRRVCAGGKRVSRDPAGRQEQPRRAALPRRDSPPAGAVVSSDRALAPRHPHQAGLCRCAQQPRQHLHEPRRRRGRRRGVPGSAGAAAGARRGCAQPRQRALEAPAPRGSGASAPAGARTQPRRRRAVALSRGRIRGHAVAPTRRSTP